MALDADDEILQDFLVEASEILEKLNEELVELEHRPSDAELLNSVFRGFHTIKGGAGFLSLDALVNVCHRAEDVFNLLRNGEKSVTPELMDVMLEVLDVLNDQFESIRAMEEPENASPELLQQLEAMNCPDGAEPVAQAEPEPAAVIPPPAPSSLEESTAAGDQATEEGTTPAASGDITDEEFEVLLDALHPPGGEQAAEEAQQSPETAGGTPGNDEEITEDEFDALLDELHGKGKFGAIAGQSDSATEALTGKPSGQEAGGGADEEITEDEFDALLDELHGKGKFGAIAGQGDSAAEALAGKPSGQEAGAGEEITEDEFDALLDELHGKGKFGAIVGQGGEAARAEPTAASKAPEPPKKVEVPEPAAAKPAAAPQVKEKRKTDAAPQAETTVRVDTKRLDDIMNMVGELVLVRNRLATLANGGDGSVDKEEMGKAVANLDVVTGDLQTSVMKTRMQPIKKVFGRFPRVVRDLARSMKKEVNLVLQGEDTDLDKNLVEALADPLVHLVRNAVDHGVEMPDDREAKGKPRMGTVRLAAEQEGDHILLSIQDDGAGMDPELLRRLAIKKGVLDEDAAARIDDKEAFMLIFAPGFSTKEQISDISGRGVGMDVVKTRISQLNGTIEIDSELGKGTLLSIKVPLTLAIMPTLMVKLYEQTFALPLVSVSEIFSMDLTETNVVDGQLVIMIRGRALPLFYLSRWLAKGKQGIELPKTGHVVVVNVGTQQIGFVVDHLIGQEEVVIKPLGAMLYGTPGMAGATITGNGKIALILDVPSLMKAYS